LRHGRREPVFPVSVPLRPARPAPEQIGVDGRAFHLGEAHGGGNAIIYNYLLEKGGYEYNAETQKVKVNFDKIGPALEELANIVLMIQANGDYQGAKDLIAKYVVNSPSMETLRKKLEHLPVDIKPVYEIEQMYK
jgi:hypothetical protein